MEKVVETVHQEIDHLFRSEYAKLISLLISKFGQQYINQIEDAVQNALVKASQHWSFGKLPENKTAWLYQVAKNNLLDQLRREKTFLKKTGSIAELSGSNTDDFGLINEPIHDSLLQTIFITCQPGLSKDARMVLTLKVMCGLSIQEIADAFLIQPETIAQRLLRAKKKMKNQSFEFNLLEPDELNQRIDDILDVIYFMFNEGYHSYSEHSLIRDDLCFEALRLIQILRDDKRTACPKVYALSSLMLFQTSRLETRITDDSTIILLADQDRNKWNRKFIEQALEYLNKASIGYELSSFHLQAGIAALHATAESFKETDWYKIRHLYDLLFVLENNPVVQINRSVTTAMIEGPQAAIDELNELKQDNRIKDFLYLDLLFAEFHKRLEETDISINFYRLAESKTRSPAIKSMIKKKILELEKTVI